MPANVFRDMRDLDAGCAMSRGTAVSRARKPPVSGGVTRVTCVTLKNWMPVISPHLLLGTASAIRVVEGVPSEVLSAALIACQRSVYERRQTPASRRGQAQRNLPARTGYGSGSGVLQPPWRPPFFSALARAVEGPEQPRGFGAPVALDHLGDAKAASTDGGKPYPAPYSDAHSRL